jgi:predicted MFS family arabinose efflux permease
MHYALIIAVTTFTLIFVAGGIRSTPGVLTVALEREFGWSRATISGAVALSLGLYGALGPFVAAFFRFFSLQRTVVCALLVLAVAVSLTTAMRTAWHLYVLWGLLVGVGSSVVAPVLGKVVASRWFEARAGLAMGLFSASAQTGQVALAPALGALVERFGWRIAAAAMAGVAGAAVVPAVVLLRDSPASVGCAPYGAKPVVEGAPPPPPPPPPSFSAIVVGPCGELLHLLRDSNFLLLSASFFVCGASTNGLIGVHLVPACVDVGLSETASAGFLAVIGVFDILGTLFSGWLTDRCDSRHLLCFFYFFRGAALVLLPLALSAGQAALWPFAVVYGLDWVATVPPTAALCTHCFGKERSNVAFAWCFCAHQIGAAAASAGAGGVRTALGSYSLIFYASGGLCVITAAAVLCVGRRGGAAEESAESGGLVAAAAAAEEGGGGDANK